jgi:hypothetical protein
MGFSSIRNSRVTSSLTNSEITSLVDAGITSTRLKQGIAEGKTYNQLLSSISFTTTSYMTTYNANLQQAIVALTGQTIQEYASSQGFTVESFQGSTYLKKEFLSSASYAPPTLLSGLNAIILLVAGGGGATATGGSGGAGAGGLLYYGARRTIL